MDEARRTKSILYPLARDMHNLQTFVANIHNILHAQPDRFAVAAAPGLEPLRKTLKSLAASARLMSEVNELAVRESALAASLSGHGQVLLLQPAQHLNQTVCTLQNPVDNLYRLVSRLNAYLNPVFVYSVAAGSTVQLFAEDVSSVQKRLNELKKSVCRLTDYEMTAGLPAQLEHHLALQAPQLSVIAAEAGDIAEQSGSLMGQMGYLQELSSRLTSLIRMGAALDQATQDLVPGMGILKQIGGVLAQFRIEDRDQAVRIRELNRALSQLDLPVDALMRLEYRLQRHADQYVYPILNPLSELAGRIKGMAPEQKELQQLLSNLRNLQGRFNHLQCLMNAVFERFETLFADYKKLTHAA